MYYIEVVTRFTLHLAALSYLQNIKEIALTRGFQIFTMDVAEEYINTAEVVLEHERENGNIIAWCYGIKEATQEGGPPDATA